MFRIVIICTLDSAFNCTYDNCMEFIKMTELRTKTKELKETLAANGKIILIDRSEPIGEITAIKPKKALKKGDAKIFDEARKQLAKQLDPKINGSNYKEIYRKMLQDEYGI